MKNCAVLLLLFLITADLFSQENSVFTTQEKVRILKSEFNNSRINNVALLGGDVLFFFSDSGIFKADLRGQQISRISLNTCDDFTAFQVYFMEESHVYYFLNENSSAYITVSELRSNDTEPCVELTQLDRKSKGKWTGIIHRKNIVNITEDGMVLLAAGGVPHPSSSDKRILTLYGKKNVLRIFKKGKCVESFGSYDPIFSENLGLNWARYFYSTFSKSRNEYLLGFGITENIYRYTERYEYTGRFGVSFSDSIPPIPQIKSNGELQLLGFKPEIETYNYRDIIEDEKRNLLIREVFKPAVDTTELDIDWVRLLVDSENSGEICLQPNPSLQKQGPILLDKTLNFQVYDLSTLAFIENIETSLKFRWKFLGIDSLGRYLYYHHTKDAIEIYFCTFESMDTSTND